MSSQQYLDNMYKLGAMGMSLMNQNRQNAAYQEAQEDKKQYKTAMGLVTAPMSTSALAQANQNITEGDYQGLGSPWNADLRKSAMNYIPAGEDAVKQEVANALGIQPAFVKAQTDYANSQSAIGNAKKLGLEVKEKENQQFVSDFAGKIASAYLNGQKDPAQIEGFGNLSGLQKVQVQAKASEYILANEQGRKDVEDARAARAKADAEKMIQSANAIDRLYSNGKIDSANNAIIKTVSEMNSPHVAKLEKDSNGKDILGLYFDYDGDGELDDHLGYYTTEQAIGFLRERTEADFFRESLAAEQMKGEKNAELAQKVMTASKDGQEIQYIMQYGKGYNKEYIVIGDKDYTVFKDMKSMIEAGYKLPDNAHRKETLANQKTQAEINEINSKTGVNNANRKYIEGAKTDNASGAGKDLANDKLLDMAIAYLGQDNLATMDAETRKIAILGALNDLSSIFGTGGRGGGATAEDEILTYFDRNGKVNNGKGEPKPVPRPSNVLAEIKDGEEEETEESWLEKFDRKMKSLGRGNVSFADLEKKRTADGNWHIGLKD